MFTALESIKKSSRLYKKAVAARVENNLIDLYEVLEVRRLHQFLQVSRMG